MTEIREKRRDEERSQKLIEGSPCYSVRESKKKGEEKKEKEINRR